MSDDFENITNEWDSYEPPSQFRRPPNAGVYTLMRDAASDFKAGVAKSDKVGTFVWYNFRSNIQGGDFDGFTVFGGCNTMVSTFRAGTTVQDYIKSSRSAIRPTSAELLKEAIAQDAQDNKSYVLEQVAGPFTAKLDWEFRCKDCEDTFLKGQAKPKSPKRYTGPKPVISKTKDGLTNHIQKCPSCQAEVGANAVIVSFIVKDASATATAKAPIVDVGELAPAAG